MPTFTPPAVVDLPSVGVESEYVDPLARRLWRFFGPRGPRGRSVMRRAGVYETVDVPTHDELVACDPVKWPNGEVSPEFYLGGHIYEVTADVAAALTAAGYGAYLT